MGFSRRRRQRRQWHPTPVLLPGKSHGWTSLEGWSPWGHWGSDMTERLHFHLSLSCIGEGNGNPLQCSCLENPRDGGAWWAAVYGLAQSRTRLKWLSSSSSRRRRRKRHQGSHASKAKPLESAQAWYIEGEEGNWCSGKIGYVKAWWQCLPRPVWISFCERGDCTCFCGGNTVLLLF